MRIIDLLEAQANLEELIDELKPGEWFAISVDGQPRVKVMALTPEEFEQLKLEEEQPSYAVAFAQNSSNALDSSAAICCAVACSMTKRCMRYTSLPSRRMAIAGEVGGLPAK